MPDKRELITDLADQPIGVRCREYQLIIQSNALVDALVRTHHYSHKATKNRMLSMVVLYDGYDMTSMGFIQLGYGIRPHMKHTISPHITTTNYAEFDRMWLSDELPKFSETTVIGMLLWFIKRWNPKIDYVITYADGSVGNRGTIYKASNAFPIGKVPVDFYKLANGERVHPVSMWHRHKTRAKEAMETLYPGIQHIQDEYQYRFLYILDNKKRKQWIKETQLAMQ